MFALEAARRDGRCPRTDCEDCAQEVFVRLWTRLSRGQCPVRTLEEGTCQAYVKQMVKHWITDRFRRAKRRHDNEKRFADEPHATPSTAEQDALRREANEEAACVRALLDRVAQHAIDARQARHRSHLVQGWAEIVAIVYEGRTLPELLEESGQLAPGAPKAEINRARNVAYKRHGRTREALEQALNALAAAGALTAEEVEHARLAIAALARCQRDAPAGVGEPEEP